MELGARIHRQLVAVVAVTVVVSLVGLVLLWPSSGDLPSVPASEPTVAATVVEIVEVERPADLDRGISGQLAQVTVELEEGTLAGARETIRIDQATYPDFAPGDPVTLGVVRQVDGGPPSYYIADFRRLPSLSILVGLFVALVLAVGRWHGLRSLVGLALSLVIIVRFVVPAILAGSSPPLVALIGATTIMVLTLYLSHGVNEKTTSAIVGTTAALLVTVGLGALFIGTSRLTGLTSDDALLARLVVQGLDLQGLVLAGLIIASLGVLDDVTVSQASTVFALHDTDRRLGFTALFARAMQVGRDHIASVVNTLVLAYVGASLTIFVLFSVGGVGTGERLNSEILAEEIVKTIVGSIGLVLAVPLTTALAAAVAIRIPPGERLPETHVGHHHGPTAVGEPRDR